MVIGDYYINATSFPRLDFFLESVCCVKAALRNKQTVPSMPVPIVAY